MSCNSYAFDTECSKETRSLFLLFLLCLSLAYQVLSLLLLIYWSPIAVWQIAWNPHSHFDCNDKS